MALRPEWFHAWKQKQDFAVNICHLSDSFDQSDIHLQSILRSWGYHKHLSLRPFIWLPEKKHYILANDDKLLYSDDHHLSPYGHELFFNSLVDAVNSWLVADTNCEPLLIIALPLSIKPLNLEQWILQITPTETKSMVCEHWLSLLLLSTILMPKYYHQVILVSIYSSWFLDMSLQDRWSRDHMAAF